MDERQGGFTRPSFAPRDSGAQRPRSNVVVPDDHGQQLAAKLDARRRSQLGACRHLNDHRHAARRWLRIWPQGDGAIAAVVSKQLLQHFGRFEMSGESLQVHG